MSDTKQRTTITLSFPSDIEDSKSQLDHIVKEIEILLYGYDFSLQVSKVKGHDN